MASETVIITGSRNLDDYKLVANTLDHVQPKLVVHGGCSGADLLAKDWALQNQVPDKCFSAEWDRHGRAAGPIRNVEMLENYPDAHVLAFPLKGSKGTWNCIKEAQARSMKVDIMEVKAKPFLRWVGGKRTFVPILAPRIHAYLDETGGRYFEPFIGGGAMALALGRDKMVISDVNTDLIHTYSQIRDNVEQLAMDLLELSSWGTGEENYYIVRGTLSEESLDIAVRMVYLSSHSFNGLWRMNKKGLMNAAYGKKPDRITEELINKLGAASESLKTTDTFYSDFEPILKLAQKGDLVYMDPPYDGTFTGYTEQGFCGLTQGRLAQEIYAAQSRGVAIISHNSDNQHVRELYKNFYLSKTKETQSINSDGAGRGKKSCLLISSHPDLID